ncbi:hypothetical protein Droror1_Dr00020284 [Drosera rotundifolia]
MIVRKMLVNERVEDAWEEVDANELSYEVNFGPYYNCHRDEVTGIYYNDGPAASGVGSSPMSKRDMPILAKTADVIHATYDECLKCGMDGYVSKPLVEENLF